MSRFLSVVLPAVLAAFVAAGCCTPSAIIGSQPVALEGQHTSMWCWAASGQMTMNFLGASPAVQQCDEANKRFGRTDCCNSPTPGDCVVGGWPEYSKYGFSADRTADTALTFAQVKDQLYCKKKPVAFTWHWDGGGGHMMVLTGYAVIGGTEYVTINNPWPWSTTGGGVQSVLLYSDYVSDPGDHTHWDDFYNITKQ